MPDMEMWHFWMLWVDTHQTFSRPLVGKVVFSTSLIDVFGGVLTEFQCFWRNSELIRGHFSVNLLLKVVNLTTLTGKGGQID